MSNVRTEQAVPATATGSRGTPQPGKVFLVGAGPGDAKLITLRGLEALQQADVILYDRLANPRLLDYAPDDAERIYVGKMPDRHSLTQEEINALLVEKALAGKTVVRLKGGDPCVFGRVGEEAEALAAHGIPFEIVPGITAGIAVPAYAGIPVTHRDFNSSVAFVTGHERPDKEGSSINWAKLATAVDTLVFYMGVGNLPFIVEQLLAHGRAPDTPVAVIRWGTLPEQQTVTGTLATIVERVREAGLQPPAITVVGDVVRLREKLAWYEKKPLFGKRVLVTRARAQASDLSCLIAELGGEPVEFPVIRLVSPRNPASLDAALDRLDAFDWVIFTSTNGVAFFFRRLRERGIDIRTMARARVAAVGPKTAEALEEKGLRVELLPQRFDGDALAAALAGKVKPGDRVLLPRADIARKALPEALRALGAEVTEADTYDNVIDARGAEEVAALLREKRIHVVTFTSSSTVRNFVEALKDHDVPALLDGVTVACIGPLTARTAEALGLRVDAVAEEATIEGLVRAIGGGAR